MSGKYQIFYPGEYLDWEKDIIEQKLAMARGAPPKVGEVPGIPGEADVANEQELLKFNRSWDPYNPLFNDKKYAQDVGYPDVPALPCYKSPMAGNAMAMTIPMDTGDIFYYANDGGNMEFFAPIFPGDSFTSENEKTIFEDTTVLGSDIRTFKMGGTAKMYNQKGELVVRSTTILRNAYRKIIDGSPKPSSSGSLLEWAKHLPPAHYTTDEDWEYIKELWDKEYIRGKDTLYWEDVKVGDEPTWTCSGPISHMDMIGWYGGNSTPIRDVVKRANTLFRDQYGMYLPDTAMHYGGRNIPGSRMVFYNDTGSKHITRMVTNYIGDAGFVTGVCWRFRKLSQEMQELVKRPGGEFLDKVPYMKGKECTRHGSEGDTVIAKGYVTDKYVNDRGEHIIDLTCWGETLDGDIIQVVGASAKLPSKGV